MAAVRVESAGERVGRSLRENCRFFEKALGSPRPDGEGGLEFPAGAGGADCIRVRYEAKRKFLGATHHLVIEADVEGGNADAGEAELRYAGFFSRDHPAFVPAGGRTNGWIEALNADAPVLELCRGLDLEGLTISRATRNSPWRLTLRPYGGCFLHFHFPPLKYDVLLPQPQAGALLALIVAASRVLRGASERNLERSGGSKEPLQASRGAVEFLPDR